jgi:hypothetical protein
MPDLSFEVEAAEVVLYAAAPMLAFKLRVHNRVADEPIHTVALRCQIMIDPARRRYRDEEQERLRDLFGEPERWGQTVRPMLWTHTNVIVPSFTGNCAVDLQVSCTFDFNVAATKYFAGLTDGEVPLNLLFSGTVFYATGEDALQVAQIPWDREARFRLPVGTWNQMMEIYYPNSAWLALRRDVFDRLYHYKVRRGIATFEQAIERLLPDDERPGVKESVH